MVKEGYRDPRRVTCEAYPGDREATVLKVTFPSCSLGSVVFFFFFLKRQEDPIQGSIHL